MLGGANAWRHDSPAPAHSYFTVQGYLARSLTRIVLFCQLRLVVVVVVLSSSSKQLDIWTAGRISVL